MISSLDQYLITMAMTPIIDPLKKDFRCEATTPYGITVCFEGLSGIGKSQTLNGLGELVNRKVHCLIGSSKSPEEFAGALVPTPTGIRVECVMRAARQCLADNGGVIFIDEVSNMRNAVQAACLSMIDEHYVGDLHLPPKTWIVMAMNPEKYAANGHPLTAAFANKTAHIPFDGYTPEQTNDWSLGIPNEYPLRDIANPEKAVQDNFYKYWATVNALRIGFNKRRGDLLKVQPEADDPASSKAWPSPRTWHWAICAITTARCLGMPTDIEGEIVESLVGEKAAGAWNEWVAMANLPDPEKMLRDGWKYDRKRLDISLTALTSLVSYVTSRPYKDAVKAALPTWKILKSVIEDGNADLVVSSSKRLIINKLGRKHHGDVALEAAAKEVIVLLDTNQYSKADLRDD